MREYDIAVREAFSRGLRTDGRVGRGVGRNFLSHVYGFKPLEVGLRPTDSVVDPLDEAAATWPTPQLACEHDEILLLGRNAIQLVDEETWTLGAPLVFQDFYTGQTRVLDGGGPWHWIERQDFGLYTNGWEVVIRSREDEHLGHERVNRVAQVGVSSVTYSGGRVFYGGFNPADIWTDDWRNAFASYLEASPFEFDFETETSIEDSYVFWSSIGGDELWPFAHPDVERWLDIFERNEAGFAPMPWKGRVLRVLPLGDGVVVYGDKGIAFLRHLSSPAATFGIVPVAPFGIASRSAAGGDDREHVFVAADGEVWRLSSDLQPARAGYRDDVGVGLEGEYVVSRNAFESETHIAGLSESGPFCFILTPQGLGESDQVPTGIVSYLDEPYSIVFKGSGDYRIAVTEIFDFGYRDMKTVTFVEVGGQTGSETVMEVALDYRYEKDKEFARTPWVMVNPEGFARIQATAIEFRLAIRTTLEDALVELDYLNIKIQPSGRRTTRGITSATEVVSRPG